VTDQSMAVVITTIQAPTRGVSAIAKQALSDGFSFIVVGDRKTPEGWSCEGATYLSYSEQSNLPFEIASCIPANSYARKMLGYLIAAQQGVRWLRETDDDNLPYDSFFATAPTSVRGRAPRMNCGWINAYSYFTDRFVWPRGFPLGQLHEGPVDSGATDPTVVESPLVFQSLADGDPDVDAIYRMTAPDTSEILFQERGDLVLSGKTWCPFNSQATTWPSTLLPLMYLPSTCSFRMTDIWRSFIAQRLLRGLNGNLVFTSATVYQERNQHNLLNDFADEIEGYLGYERFVSVLEGTHISATRAGLLEDISTLYNALIAEGFFSEGESFTLQAWLTDMRSFGFGE